MLFIKNFLNTFPFFFSSSWSSLVYWKKLTNHWDEVDQFRVVINLCAAVWIDTVQPCESLRDALRLEWDHLPEIIYLEIQWLQRVGENLHEYLLQEKEV